MANHIIGGTRRKGGPLGQNLHMSHNPNRLLEQRGSAPPGSLPRQTDETVAGLLYRQTRITTSGVEREFQRGSLVIVRRSCDGSRGKCEASVECTRDLRLCSVANFEPQLYKSSLDTLGQ